MDIFAYKDIKYNGFLNPFSFTWTMKTKLQAMGIITILCSLFGCTAHTTDLRSMNVEEFERSISDKKEVVRLDVRTADEYAEGHIPEAVNIDVLRDDFESKAKTCLPKNKTVAVYCRSGRRSKKAADILVKNGYKVIELDKGYMDWTAAGRTVTKDK